MPAQSGDYRRKLKTLDELAEILGPHPRERKVVMCHGTFDIVHPGHVRHLLYARGKGDVLVASLTCDAHVSKADYRPYVPEDLRAMNLAALEAVDWVLIDRNPTPIENLRRLQPDYFAKGYEYADGGLHPRTREEVATVEEYGGSVLFTPGDVVYSSSALMTATPPTIAADKLLLLLEAEKLDFGDLRAALELMKGLRVHVLGDTIVDTHTNCSVIGQTAKTPTLSVRYEGEQHFAGGAAVVARHVAAAGASLILTTVLGDDPLKDFVLDDLRRAGVRCRAFVDPSRPTTHKNVLVAGGYRLVKIDTVDNRSVSTRTLDDLARAVRKTSSNAVVFSDFRHGIFNRDTIPKLCSAIPEGVFRAADSQVASRWGNILEFKGFDLITPNEREARFALGDQDSVVRPLAWNLYREADCGVLMLKLGDRGLLTYRSDEVDDYRGFFTVDTFAERAVDPVGCGDALLAYATLAQCATRNAVVASVLGSLAAAVECERDGNVPVTPDNVRERIDELEKLARYL